MIVVLAADRSFELADAAAEAAAELRQALGSEDEEGDDQDDRDLGKSDVSWHSGNGNAGTRSPGGRGPGFGWAVKGFCSVVCRVSEVKSRGRPTARAGMSKPRAKTVGGMEQLHICPCC